MNDATIPVEPPEWAMREARGLLRKSCPPSNIYDTCPIEAIARALVTARREALIAASAALEWRAKGMEDRARGDLGSMFAAPSATDLRQAAIEVRALIDKDEPVMGETPLIATITQEMVAAVRAALEWAEHQERLGIGYAPARVAAFRAILSVLERHERALAALKLCFEASEYGDEDDCVVAACDAAKAYAAFDAAEKAEGTDG